MINIPNTLREEAEVRLSNVPATELPSYSNQKMLHELQIQHVELEMQNEALLQSQTEIDDARGRYSDLFDLAPVSYCVVSMQGLILQANFAVAALLGVFRRLLVNARISHFILDQDKDIYYLFSKSLFDSGKPMSCELRMVKNDGTNFWTNLSATLAFDEDGTPELRIMLNDITERKQAEDELRIAAIAFESQTGMIVTDPNSVILRINKAFTSMTGYSEQEVLGQTLHLIHSGQHKEDFYRIMWCELKETGFWQGEIWNRHKNGTIDVEWLTISAVIAPKGIVTHYIGTYFNIIQNMEAAKEIHNLAYYDPLTKLPNRRLLQDRLSKALAVSTRNKLYGAILFLDLDHFKMINDTRGHDAGDQLLVAVSDRLRNIVREIDTLARLGGDEFVMLLEDLDKDLAIAASQAKLVGEKVLAVLAEPYLIYDNEFYCTVSIGVSMYRGLETAEELLGYADLAMYEAKSTGRNGLRFFDATMQEVVTARSMLEQDLRQALAKNQFKIFFQLQTNHDGQILGAEALLRWEHPERGLVLPMEFIHLAEETKLILPIGLWVLNAACAQLKIWEDMPQAQHLQLAVNVSAYQFHQACFVEQVCTVLEKHAIQADRLKLEITESLLTSNIDDTLIKMKALKNIGIHFSMDDFGTGYSSLSVLKKLPINQLKIDQSFIRDISIDSDDAIIVQTIIAMANKLGMEVIAEGVETEEQRAFLELQGCPVIQGYLFGKPVPIEQFEQLLNHN
jgi:diguanylate cyclase (GGDEF)-like protein/PAS domain S-box-containing protein